MNIAAGLSNRFYHSTKKINIAKIAKFEKGSNKISEGYIRNNPGNYPVYSSKTKNGGILGWIKDYNCNGESITWTTHGKYAGTVFYHGKEDKFSITNNCGLIRIIDQSFLPKYVYYLLDSVLKKHVNPGMGISQLKIGEIIENISIPLLSVNEQKKIIFFLDSLKQLINQLEIELKLRKNQFAYCREIFFNFKDLTLLKKIFTKECFTKEIKYVPLGEICTLEKGTNKSRKQLKKGKYPVVAGGKKPSFYCDEFNREPGCIVVATSGTAGFISYWEQRIFCSDSFSIITKNKNTVLTKYVYYFLLQNQVNVNSLIKSSTISHIYPKDLKKITIPVPPSQAQQKIVKTLDNFEILTNDQSNGLLLEIELCKKQYEYCRNLFFDFSKKLC